MLEGKHSTEKVNEANQIKSNQIKIFIFLQLQDMYIGFPARKINDGRVVISKSLEPIPEITIVLCLYTIAQGWAKLVLIALERYSVELKRLTFNFR